MSIILEGDATNIRELWDGVGLEDKERDLTPEEQLNLTGFKRHMIVVPHKLRKQGYDSDWRKLPDQLVPVAQQYTLRKLAYYLEQEGRDYPAELPDLGTNKFILMFIAKFNEKMKRSLT